MTPLAHTLRNVLDAFAPDPTARLDLGQAAALDQAQEDWRNNEELTAAYVSVIRKAASVLNSHEVELLCYGCSVPLADVMRAPRPLNLTDNGPF